MQCVFGKSLFLLLEIVLPHGLHLIHLFIGIVSLFHHKTSYMHLSSLDVVALSYKSQYNLFQIH